MKKHDLQNQLPHSIEAEQSVLGGLMLENNAWNQIIELISEQDFYRYEHKLIFKVMATLQERWQPLDALTISELLKELGELENIGGEIYLFELIKNTPSASNIKAYANIVRERSLSRKLISLANDIVDNALNPQGRRSADLLSVAEKKAIEISQINLSDEPIWKPALEIFKNYFDLDKSVSKQNVAYTGLPALNHALKDLTGGRLIVIAGRPGQGKSALAIQIMVNALFKEKKVGYISLEMGENEVISRMMANRYEYNVSELQRGDRNVLQNLMYEYSENPFPLNLFFSEGPSKISSLLREIKKLKNNNVDFLIIDHIGLIDAQINFNASRNDQLGEITSSLKSLSHELRMPIIALSQLNRASENEKRRPHLSDLRDSGNIEQDADAVIMFYEETKTNDGIKIFDLGLLKNRGGTTGWLGPRFAFNGSIQKFTEIMLNVQVR